MTKKTYKVQGLHCTSCPLVIEGDLEDAGIKASCSYAKSTLEVEFDERKLDEAAILKIVKGSGYDLTVN